MTSWRTTTPRQAQDELAGLFFRHGAKLWFLQTNQVGGWNPDITPLAPTPFFGLIKIPFTEISPIPILLNRMLASLALPKAQVWLVVIVVILIYGAIALPLGLFSGFLQFSIWPANWMQHFLLILRCLLTPSLTEELVFRVFLLPHPTEVVNWHKSTIWAILSLLLFIFYHPLNAKTFFRPGFPTFFNPVFLTLTGLLGLSCTITYALSGSLWAIATIHWVVVVIWLLFLGGMHRLHPYQTQKSDLNHADS